MADKSGRNAERLVSLATQRFGKLSEYETRVLRASADDDCIICETTRIEADSDSADNPAKADTLWGKEREVQASLIRWLCVVSEASRCVAPRGIQVRGARITGLLDLSAVVIPFPLSLLQCRLGKLDLRYATIPLLLLGGSLIESLNADGAKVRTMAFLNEGFSAREVRLVGANVGGTLDFRRATLKTLAVALHADRLWVKGNVLFDGFSSDGDIGMSDAQIGGILVCEGGKFAGLNLQRTGEIEKGAPLHSAPE